MSKEGEGKAAPVENELDALAHEFCREILDLFGALDAEGRVVGLCGRLFAEGGVDPQMLLGQIFAETVFWQSDERNAEEVVAGVQLALRGTRSRVCVDFRINSETSVPVEMSMVPVQMSMSAARVVVKARRLQAGENTDSDRREREHLLFTAENAEIGLWYWDLKSRKIYSTPKCNELFELEKDEELTVESLLRILHPDDVESFELFIARARTSERKYDEEFRVVYANGQTDWISAQGQTYLDELGRPDRITGLVKNITSEKAAAEELSRLHELEKRARDEAIDANRSKDFFLAFVSHELRSPLNAIMGWSKILLTKSVDEKTNRTALETIERSAKVQEKLINDLVDTSRVTSGKLQLENHPVDLVDVLKNTVHAQRPTAEGQKIGLEFTPSAERISIFGDLNRLQQIFSNLISNAIKFTPEDGKVSISTKVEDNRAIIEIRDTGQGIGAEALPLIFRQFSQGDITGSKRNAGLGLGLSIVKILVEKHGGIVEAESEGLDRGATFRVILPVMQNGERPVPIDSKEIKKRPAVKPLAGLDIVMVEDDNDSREVLQLFLEQCGAKVESAESVKKAFEILDRRGTAVPDIIISDLAMPDEDGYSLMSRVRSVAGPLAAVPSIALTAFSTVESRQKASESGFQKYLTKPFEPDLLIADVIELTRKKD